MRLFVSSIQTSTPSTSTYEAEADSLFARFTNTYTTTEKDLINGVILDLKTAGIWDKLDHLYMGAVSGSEEQLLDWKGVGGNITKTVENVREVPYRGLSPQTGYYSTNSNPTTDANISLDSAFVSFKAFQGYEIPYANYYFGADGLNTFRLKPYISGLPLRRTYALDFLSASPYYVFLPTDAEYNDTVCFSRTNNTMGWFINGTKVGSATSNMSSLPNADILIGGAIASSGQSNNNSVQHLAWGSALTDTEAQTLTTIIDDFCNAQSALSPYLQETGFTINTYDVDFKAVMGEKCVYTDFDKLYTSNDLGTTVRSEIAFSFNTYGNIEMAYIFDDEKIIFATSKNKIYKSTLDLGTITEMTPTKNGSTYTLHTPNDSNYPGEYYKHLGAIQKMYLGDGTEIFLWGNYCNVWNGASPVLVWYSFGDEIKVAFEYGQNQYRTDNGQFIPTQGGTLLGDASQTIKTRHVHSVSQRPDSLNTFYVTGGDNDHTEFYESNWVQLDYNPTLDTWSSSLLMEGAANTRVKVNAAQMPNDGYVYYSSDANNIVGDSSDDGWWRSTYANLTTLSSHERIFLQSSTERPLNFFDYDGSFFMGGGYAAGNQPFGLFGEPDIIWSDDGITFNEVILPIAGNSYFYRITKIGTKKYLLNAMMTYSYTGAMSVILDFN